MPSPTVTRARAIRVKAPQSPPRDVPVLPMSDTPEDFRAKLNLGEGMTQNSRDIEYLKHEFKFFKGEVEAVTQNSSDIEYLKHELKVFKQEVEAEIRELRRHTLQGVNCHGQSIEVSSMAHGVESTENSADFNVNQTDQARAKNGSPTKAVTQQFGNSIADAPLFYEFKNNTWDSMMFLGLSIFRTSDSLMIVVVGLANFIIQVLFTFLVNYHIIEDTFTSDDIVLEMQDWRVKYAHNVEYADKFTSTPLSVAVCDKSDFLMEGTLQANLYLEISKYLEPFLYMPCGATLCMLSIFVWVLTCWRELADNCLLFNACWTSATSAFVNQDAPDHTVSIEEIWGSKSSGRKASHVTCLPGGASEVDNINKKVLHISIGSCRACCVTCLIIVPRMTIVVLLCVAGIRFLVSTIQLSDLILNAISLEVVLHVDEFLFHVLIPRVGHRIVRVARPLRATQPSRTWMSVSGLKNIVALCLVMTLTATLALGPIVSRLHDTDRAMCQGDTQFLFAELEFGAVVAGGSKKVVLDRDSYSYRAILQRCQLAEDQGIYYQGEPYMFDNAVKLQTWKDRSLKETASIFYLDDPTGRACADDSQTVLHPEIKSATWAMLQYTLGVSSVTTCAEIASYCFLPNNRSSIVRHFCPNTCGGADMLSGLLYDTTSFGIPLSCDQEKARSLRSLRCTDVTLEPWQNSAWTKYTEMVLAFLRPKLITLMGQTEGEDELLSVQRLFGEAGCKSFDKPFSYINLNGTGFSVDFCNPDDPLLEGLRSARPLCPNTCQCNGVVKLRHQAMHIPWSLSTQCAESCFA